MNKNIAIKIKPEKLKEFGEYLIGIGEEVNKEYCVVAHYTAEWVYAYNSKYRGGWDWAYEFNIESYKNIKIITYNTFMRQVKLERILK